MHHGENGVLKQEGVRPTLLAGTAEAGHDKKVSLNLQLGSQAVICFAGMLFGKVAQLALQVLLGRSLGAARYGLYSLGFSIVTVIAWPAAAGLDWGVLRYGALYRKQGDPARIRETLRAALGMGTATSLLIAGTAVALAAPLARKVFGNASFSGVLMLFAASLPILVLVRILSSFVQSQQQIFRMTMIQQVSQPFWNLVLAAGAIWLGWSVRGAVTAFLASFALTLLLAFRYAEKTLPSVAPRPRHRLEMGTLLRYSMALAVVGVTYQCLLRAPTILLAHLGNAPAVGVYSAGASFAMAMALFPGVFGQPFLPMMVHLYEGNDLAELRRLYQSVTRWTAMVIMPVSLLLCLFRSEIMALYGKEFRASAPVLLALTLAWLVYFVKGPVDVLLDMTGRQNIHLLNLLAALALTSLLCWLWIPARGSEGAALATASGLVALAILESFEAWLLYGIFPWGPSILRHVAVAAAAGTVGLIFRGWAAWPFRAALIIAVYAVLFLLLCLSEEDRELFRSGHSQIRNWIRVLGVGGAVQAD